MAEAPYYADELVTLYHGDCREVTEWLAADVLVTDPPYGRGWGQHGDYRYGRKHDGIAGDIDPSARDAALALWDDRAAVVFGDLMLAPPPGTRQVLVYAKAPGSGFLGCTGGFRRDAEAVCLVGRWPQPPAAQTSVLRTGVRNAGGGSGMTRRYGHPHAKPVDVLETLICACPPGVIADPFAGSGSTLVAARNLGRRAIGVELEERYCELAARRLAQGVLSTAEASGE